MKSFVNLLGRILVGLSILFLFLKLAANLGEIRNIQIENKATLSILFIIIINVVIALVSTYAWLLFLRTVGFGLPFKQALVIYGQSAIGKYIPGNIFHLVGRVTLGTKYGIPKEKLVYSIFIETLMVTATAILFGFAGILLGDKYLLLLAPILGKGEYGLLVIVLFIAISIVIILPFIFARGKKWLKANLSYLDSQVIIKSIVLYLLTFLLVGVSIDILINALWEGDYNLQWYQFAYGFAFAWCLGYITPGAPGGMGIREAILVALYGQELGDGIVVAMVLFLRLLMTIGELTVFVISYFLDKSEPVDVK
ncbi:MAG: lysylphosphatidylglycerol synthase domain-containing protein [Candidatus Zixiibacteriota bacterium]